MDKFLKLRVVGIACALLLLAAFILLFYSIKYTHGCFGPCSNAGAGGVVMFNLLVIALISVCSAGIIYTIVRARRLEEEEDDEPMEEGTADVTSLPSVLQTPRPRNGNDDKQ